MNEFDQEMRGWMNRYSFPSFSQFLPSFSRSVPVESGGFGDKYRINIDMEGYKPEDIKVSDTIYVLLLTYPDTSHFLDSHKKKIIASYES